MGVEGDWPDAYRVNRYIRGVTDEIDAVDALAGFKRFPAWMWRNADVLDFVGWLRSYNESIGEHSEKAGFYGLDLYSLRASMEAVLAYLWKVDPDSARRARRRYGCFDHFGRDMRTYGLAINLGRGATCEDAVVSELTELRLREVQFMQRDGRVAADEYFCAEQNALVIKNAEEYYRTMFQGKVSSWNLRDTHMFETLRGLRVHLGEANAPQKVIVWAHNSHLGDARATQMGRDGEINLGQLCREGFLGKTCIVGFTTFDGTVTAASEWDGPAERKQLRPARFGSYEEVFHQVGYSRFLLNLKESRELAFHLRGPHLERAIGVIYRPETELESHYLKCGLSEQFDFVIHFDHTRAVEPLERSIEWDRAEVPETYPSGI